MDLSHVLWIGGAQGSGKSAVARAVSRRFDLQLYVIDHRAWVHEPRMPATEFGSLSLDDRWVRSDPRRMLDWFVTTSRHRFRLVLEDLRALGETPGVVVEGPQLLPTSVAAVLREPRQALFLVPGADEQRARLLARGPLPGTSDGLRARQNATERDVLLNERIAREARELRLAALTSERPLGQLIELAVEHFRPLVEDVPRGGDLAAARRLENDVLATQARLYRESLAPAVVADEPLPFSCECGTPGCDDVVELTLAGFEAISAAGDRSPLRRPTP